MPSGIYKHPPQCGYQKGHKNYITKESREKMSAAKKGKMPKNIKQINGWNKGIPNSTGISPFKGKPRPEYKGELHPNWKGGKPKCEVCGKQLKNFYSKRCSQHCYKTGADHHMWRGGITPQNKLIRHSKEYKLWRIAVFTRDNFTCIWCGKKDRTIEADHIKSFAYYPELRFAIDNGRTLCGDCHKTTDTYKARRY